MRALAATAIANDLARAFPASSLKVIALERLVLFCGAVLFIWLLSTTYGLDLSAGFF
jgi:hypothetical protein